MKKVKKIMLGIAMSISVIAQAQKETPKYEIALMGGTLQPFVLSGGNIQLDFSTRKMAFDYSHGFSLDMNSETNAIVGDAKEQGLAIHLPYSTGLGIGYRLNKYFDIRFEPKLHKFEVYYDGTDRKVAENKIADYQTVTLGLGAYFRWRPFEKQDNFLKGIITSTSIRYWQNVASTLDGGEISYENRVTQQREIHETANIGIANTPIIVNIAVGYSIQF